jgi:hypothetical protein
MQPSTLQNANFELLYIIYFHISIQRFCKQHVLRENQATVLIITKSLRYGCTSFTLTILPLIRYVKFPPENVVIKENREK